MNHLFSIYWKGDDKTKGYLYLFGIIATVGLIIAGTVFLNDWRNDFYTALEKHDIKSFWPLMLQFTLVASALVVLSAYSIYITQLLVLNWRYHLTRYFEKKWLKAHKRGVALNIDNPDQRISEDCGKVVQYFLLFGTELLKQFVFLILFSIIVWELSSALFKIPGTLLWVSLGYAVIGSLMTWWLGKPLVDIEFETQKREADYRYGLALERMGHSQTLVAMDEPSDHYNRYERLQAMLMRSFKRQKIVNFFTSSYNQIEVILPFLFIAPSFFGSVLTLGWLMQTAQAMSMVQTSIAYIVNNYTELAKMKATINRLTIFNKQLGE